MENAVAKDAYGRPPDLLEEYCYQTFRSNKKMQNIYPWITWRFRRNIYREEYITLVSKMYCEMQIKYVFSKKRY